MGFLFSLLLLSTSVFAGDLLLIGGGNRSRDILVEMVKLAEGKILIVPLASEIPQEVAASAKSQLEDAGAKNVSVFLCTDEDMDRTECLNQIRETHLIYFTGGSQNKLLKCLENSKSLQIIRERFQIDLHLAGTSAGTAIMSEVMITGEALSPYERLEGVRSQMVQTTKGLGFVQKFIVDQHFLKRHRQDRLLSAVLDHSLQTAIGIGIDESTALHVKEDGTMIVLGDSLVTVFDATKVRKSVLSDGSYVYENLSVSLLAPGTTFRLP